MTQPKKFIIDHIDPLGQGVFKESGEIYFIPKTLPGEEGTFDVKRSSKGVNFCELQSLSIKSEVRQNSDCPHYDTCNGCAYLHTNLANEQLFKISHLKRMISRSFSLDEDNLQVELISSYKRFAYRNRIQLHYASSAKVIGFMAPKSKRIIPIKNCLLASKKLQNEIMRFTKDDDWLNLIPRNSPPKGHIEFFEKDDGVQITWNKRYAEGGFEQVNPSTNKLMLEKIADLFSDRSLKILDLFGGGGNLVKGIKCEEYLSVDIYSETETSPNKLSLNLFGQSALSEFKGQNSKKFDTLFVDPPRSGFTYLDSWTQEFNPNELLYVSCHPATMVRDLKPVLARFNIEKIFLLDFFPGTKHFEAAIYLTKKQQ